MATQVAAPGMPRFLVPHTYYSPSMVATEQDGTAEPRIWKNPHALSCELTVWLPNRDRPVTVSAVRRFDSRAVWRRTLRLPMCAEAVARASALCVLRKCSRVTLVGTKRRYVARMSLWQRRSTT
jgi:hypothetical protein